MVTAEFNPFAPGVLADPYPMYRALLQHNPVSWKPTVEVRDDRSELRARRF